MHGWVPLLLVLAIVGCAGSPDGDSPQASCPSPTQGSVSPVNSWPGLDPVALAKSLSDQCQTLVEIEGLPWFPPGGPLCDEHHPTQCGNPYAAERRALLEAMSSRGISVLVNSHNSNAYAPKTWTEDMWRGYIVGIRDDMAVTGADVWLGAPSEPWAWRGPVVHRRAQVAREEWPGVFVQPDRGQMRPIGQPYWQDIASDWFEVHPCNVEDAFEGLRLDSKTLVVTDCTPVIATNLDAATQQSLLATANELHRPLIIYDHLGS